MTSDRAWVDLSRYTETVKAKIIDVPVNIIKEAKIAISMQILITGSVLYTGILLLSVYPAKAQLSQICGADQTWSRVASWEGEPHSRGGFYETEICAKALKKKNGMAMFILEANGKDAKGVAVYNLNCSNVPKGYWSAYNIQIQNQDENNIVLNSVRNAARIFCD